MKHDKFTVVCTLRSKGNTSNYFILPRDLKVGRGDEVSIKFRVHDTERWYSIFTKTSGFGAVSTGVYIPKPVSDCLNGKKGDLLDVEVEVWYNAGEHTEA